MEMEKHGRANKVGEGASLVTMPPVRKENSLEAALSGAGDRRGRTTGVSLLATAWRWSSELYAQHYVFRVVTKLRSA